MARMHSLNIEMNFLTKIRRWIHKILDEILSSNSTPSIVISDKHIGTSMWQAATLKSLGITTEVHSLSQHLHYAQSKGFGRASLFIRIAKLTNSQVVKKFSSQKKWAKLKFALCSFPPARIVELERLPDSVQLILNIGHRIHIHLPAEQIIEFTTKIANIYKNPRYTLATMSEYDYHYTRYYTAADPIRLPVVSFHLPSAVINGPYLPANRIVLIGPSHNTDTIIGFNDDLVELNKKSQAYARIYGVAPYTFDFIKSIYPKDQATPQNLARHPAVLINPYSAFSISMVELYQMNIPFLVPSDEFLVNQMGDVRLNPIYQTNEATALLESVFGNKTNDYLYSPNDSSIQAQLYWMQYMYFNQVKNACRWSTHQQLFEILYIKDLCEIHNAMKLENLQLFTEQKNTWAALLKRKLNS
jgi:hypothetical protein